MFLLGRVFLICCVLALVSPHSVECSSVTRASFTIKPGDEGIQTLKVSTNDHELLSCSFKFSTKRRSASDAEEKDITNSNVRRSSVQSVLGRLSGICIRKTIDYWKYELCFEGEIKQVHGQINNNLGRYSGLDGAIQVYDEGTPCEAKGKGRRSKVEFLCDKQLRIRSVEEVSTCSYLVIVGTPIVCGSTDFANAPADDGDSSLMLNVDERWLLELAQIGKGRYDCSVRALTGDIRARPERPSLSTLEFSRFELDVSLSSDSPTALHHDYHVVRAPDRVRLSHTEREYTLNAASQSRDRRISVISGDAFVGLIEFVQIAARTSQTVSV
jgi:hypothetical protein